jgi:hypothetical protein
MEVDLTAGSPMAGPYAWRLNRRVGIEKFREEWLRPALFFGNNPISLAGGAITTASGITMISYWLAELSGHLSDNPYLGIIFFLILPALFLLGLALIPIGVFLRRRTLQKAGQIPAVFPRIDLNDRIFRHGIDIVLVATIVNFLVVATASYHGAEYMDSPQVLRRSCHVMAPEYTAYQISPHSHVPCVECHIGTGAQAYFSAKVNGTKQLLEVVPPLAPLAPKIIPNYPTPIPSPVSSLRPARYTCEACHTPTRFDGDKLLVKSSRSPTTNRTPSRRQCSFCTSAAKIRSRIAPAFTACTWATSNTSRPTPRAPRFPGCSAPIPTAL